MSNRKIFSGVAMGAALVGVALSLPVSHQPASASEQAFLQSFVGDWRGQGSFRRSPRHEPEAVVCRANAAMNGAAQLEINGRCGGEGFTGTFRVTAHYDPASGGYAALFAGPPSVGSSQLHGHRQEDSLQLSVNHPGQPPSTLMIAQQSPSAFRIRAETAAGQQTFTSADIQLRRQ
jgi:hypothetical protein